MSGNIVLISAGTGAPSHGTETGITKSKKKIEGNKTEYMESRARRDDSAL